MLSKFEFAYTFCVVNVTYVLEKYVSKLMQSFDTYYKLKLRRLVVFQRLICDLKSCFETNYD